ncbi:MAG TPA: triose-phosphate isomerase [Caulobacteraceae bacterium]|nr:triose-phosphate isomerase [Caulobacteraceae bacterium]
MPTPLIAGNWKMNGLGADLAEARALAAGLKALPTAPRVALCPPATLVERMVQALGDSPISVGGQDCHPDPAGAHTGDISAEMLVDAGARVVIVGHSERRASYGESDALVAAKALAAQRAGLEPIICVGESRAERDAGRAIDVICDQVGSCIADELAGPFALAYEPIWAIGAGVTPSMDEIAEAHAALRRALLACAGERGRAAPILYGGSVKPDNARQILAAPDVGGALVGGASLKADDFLAIIRAAPPDARVDRV